LTKRAQDHVGGGVGSIRPRIYHGICIGRRADFSDEPNFRKSDCIYDSNALCVPCLGDIYSLFSAITGEVFGSKNASDNYEILYTAKGLSAILAGRGAAAVAVYYAGSFSVPYYIAATADIIAAAVALYILRPLIRKRIARES